MKYSAVFQQMFCSMEKPKKIQIFSKKISLPISFLSRTFLLPSILFCHPPPPPLPHEILLAKTSSKYFAGKIPPQKNMLFQNMLPKISSKENLLQKNLFPICLSKFSSKINCFPNLFSQNLLPNIFALHDITSHNEILLTNSSKIFLLAKFPPNKNLLLQNLLPKISS